MNLNEISEYSEKNYRPIDALPDFMTKGKCIEPKARQEVKPVKFCPLAPFDRPCLEEQCAGWVDACPITLLGEMGKVIIEKLDRW